MRLAHLCTLALALCAVISTSGCAGLKPKDKLVIAPARYDQLPGWGKGDSYAGALEAFKRSCGKFATLPEDRLLGTPGALPSGTVEDWHHVCKEAALTPPSLARAFFEHSFTPFRMSNKGKTEGLFTGYYEAELHGSLVKTKKYAYPLYMLPPDIAKLQGCPTLTRQAIEKGSLKGRKLELAYVDDPVELFFLQVQGSGRLTLPDGKVLRVGYAGKNGHAYSSLGKHLVDAGIFKLKEVTAPKVKAWLYAHPKERDKYMDKNQSYVFFRKLEDNLEGPLGAQGVPVTAENSLAVDTRFVPLGTPLWLATTLPTLEKPHRYPPYRRLVVAQDKGGAIKGPVRGDVFFGYGKQQAEQAGLMRQAGTYFALLPNPLAEYWLEQQEELKASKPDEVSLLSDAVLIQ